MTSKRGYVARSGHVITRRHFLYALAGFGGAAAVHRGLVSLGLASSSQANAQSPRFPETNLGQGKKVIVIGAGVAGLCTAYLLARRGFEVRIFEANDRMGGRSFTVRNGDKFQEEDGEVQTCSFSTIDTPEPYLNAGPGRIPHHHETVLKYCRQFNVALEPFIFLSSANRFQSNNFNDGKPVLFRQLQSSLHYAVAEILAKTPGTELDNALDHVFTEDDFVRMFFDEYKIDQLSPKDRRDLLRGLFAGYFGEYTDTLPKQPESLARLRENFAENSSRFGYDFTNQTPAWAGLNEGNRIRLLGLEEVLRSMFWAGDVYNPLRYEWQSSLLQPVGGMDMLWKAFLKQSIPENRTLQDLVDLNRPVKEIKATNGGVTIVYEGGSEKADFCVSTMTPRQLSKVFRNADQDYTDREYQDCLSKFACIPSTKVGLQTKSRFWEVGDDPLYQLGNEPIYGGISWIKTDWPAKVYDALKNERNSGQQLTPQDFRNFYAEASQDTREKQWATLISQVWYPSNGFHSKTGILTAAYNRGKEARVFGALSHEDRLDLALNGGEKLHPGYSRQVMKETALTIAWQNMPHFEGGWDNHTSRQHETKEFYNRLNQKYNPYLNVYLAGDYMSYLPGWMEGALGSAEIVCDLLCKRVQAETTSYNIFNE